MNFDINPDTVVALIELAREFHNQDSLPAYNDSPDDDYADTDTEPGDHVDPIRREFSYLIDDLEPGQQQQLVTLYWLGRGDFEVDQWDTMVEQAAEAWNRRTADYLLGNPQIAEYLREGLGLLGYEVE